MIKKSIIVVLCSLLVCSCLDTMTEQDHAFVRKIKQHLKKKGDVVKISDIHPGNWTKVCFTAAGAKDDAVLSLAEFEQIDQRLIKVLNRDRDETNHIDMFDWGIYFFYPPSSIEYFKIFNAEMLPSKVGGIRDEYSCVRKENAYFVSKSDPKKNKYRDDYITIQITEMKKGENE
ncbi:MAG: hypothetical protein AB2806_00900 [Candidatus Thiodiazotropha sp.]